LILLIAGAQGALWGLIFLLFRSQGAGLRRAVETSGEAVVLGPQVGLYQKSGVVSVKTLGVIVLTDRRLIFRKPLGKDIEIPLPQVAGLSENKWFHGNYRSGKQFLIVKLTDGQEIGFVLKNHALWMNELTARTNTIPA